MVTINLQSDRRSYGVHNIIWDKVLKNGQSKICGRQPLKYFTWPILEYFVPYESLMDS